MGRWAHEAAAVDPDNQQVYLTEDNSAGLFYRYTPTAYPDLSAGKLEACIVAADGSVSWGPLTDPSGATVPTREQVAGATIFPGNEGCWYHQGWVYFTSKGDHSVHGIDIAAQKYTLLWKGDPDGLGVEGAVLSHVDNITVDAGSGDLFVAEDGGNMELVIITPEGALAPFVRVVGEGHADSEMTGPVFNPSRDRLYFSSQRGPSKRDLTEILPSFAPIDAIGASGMQAGMTFEITGPFRGVMTTTDAAPPETEAPIASPVDTLVGAAPNTQDAEPVGDEDSGSGGDKSKLVVGVVVAAAAVGGVVAFRKRRIDEASGENTSGR
jgi:secreted PhoX family phosphatase